MQHDPDAQILLQPESRRLKRRCRKPVWWIVGHPPLLHRYAQPVAVQLLVGVFIVQRHHGVIARGRSGTVISTTPVWAAVASARSAAENFSGQPCAVLNTSTPTTPCAFLTFSTSTVKRYPAGEAPLSSEAKTLR